MRNLMDIIRRKEEKQAEEQKVEADKKEVRTEGEDERQITAGWHSKERQAAKATTREGFQTRTKERSTSELDQLLKKKVERAQAAAKKNVDVIDFL